MTPMAASVWTCGTCGNRSSSSTRFCVGCGRSRAESERAALGRPAQTQFNLPDYLLAARRRDPAPRTILDEDGAPGAGMIMTGAVAVAAALLFSALSRPGIAVLAIGSLAVLVGLWRMRRDPRAMERMGWLAALAGAAALALVTVQFLELRPPAIGPAADRGEQSAPPVAESADARRQRPAATGVGTGTVAMFRGDAAHSGVNPGPGPAGVPRQRWRAHTGGDIFASPVVADGRVVVGAESGYLVAFSAADGEELWRIDLGGYVARSTAVVSDGTVYAAAGYAVTAADVATGSIRWQAPVRFVGAASPTLADDRLLVPTQEGNLYALDPATGKELWRHRIEGLVFGSVAVDDGRVFAGNESGLVYALHAASGREAWRATVGGAVLGSPAASDGLVFVSSSAPSLTALDAASGRRVWTVPIGGTASPAVAGGSVYLASEDGGLTAIDAETGAPEWYSPTGTGGRAAPTVAGPTVYLPAGRSVFAVNRTDGEPLWSFPTGDEIVATAAVVDGSLYVGSRDGFVYALGGELVEETAPSG